MSYNKHNYYVLGFILTLLSLGACNPIDVEPQDALVEEKALLDLDDYEDALFGAYATLRSNNWYGRNYTFLPDILADNLMATPTNNGTYRELINWQNDPSADPGMWATLYVGIQRTNIIINGIDGVVDPNDAEEVARRDEILGQALAIRALAHFDLLRYYGEEYDRNSDNLGIVVKTNTDISQPPRNTVAETYDQVYADLEEALSLLEGRSLGRFFIGEQAVNALLARVSLYAGEWALAEQYATTAIAGVGLSDPTSFTAIWQDNAEDSEVIFELPNQMGDEIGGIGLFLYDPNNGQSFFQPSTNLTGSYLLGGDVRSEIYFISGSTAPIPSPYAFVQTKYPDNRQTQDISNIKVFRLAEMYLIRAEARARQNPSSMEALNDLREIRAARVANYNPNADAYDLGRTVLDQIQDERQRELALEGHRWFDIRRFVILGDITGIAIFRLDATCPKSLYTDCSLLAEDAGGGVNKKFTLPIPQDEILANPNMEQSHLR